MALVDFTSFDDVRAALGVSEDELEDTTLSLDLYEFSLVEEMEGISLSLISSFTTVKVKPAANRSDDETRLLQSTQVFATYAVAKHLTSTLPLFSPKEISDGKASAVRYAQNPYKDVIAAVEARYERARVRVEAALAAVTSQAAATIGVRTFFTKATPSSDPVLGT